VKGGFVSGLRTGAWLVAIVIPVSLCMNLLGWAGALSRVGSLLSPAFRLLGLPGEAPVAFLTGAAINCYSGIAAMKAIALDDRQVTILSLAILISHNLPIEVAVQRKSGSSGLRMLGLRLVASLIAALALNLILPEATEPSRARVAAEAVPLGALLASWALGTAWLVGKILLLVVGLTVLQRALSEFGLVEVLSRLLFPVLWLLGLPRRTAFLWIVANTLGLAFGAAVIIDEANSGELSREDVELLNRSVAVCHSLLEDTLLFVLMVGAWAFWITVPRVLLAAASVWLYRLARRFNPSRANETALGKPREDGDGGALAPPK
jgi:hypothetical protein